MLTRTVLAKPEGRGNIILLASFTSWMPFSSRSRLHLVASRLQTCVGIGDHLAKLCFLHVGSLATEDA